MAEVNLMPGKWVEDIMTDLNSVIEIVNIGMVGEAFPLQVSTPPDKIMKLIKEVMRHYSL